MTSIGNTPPAAATLGNAISGTGTTTLAFGSQLRGENITNANITDNAALDWVPLVSTDGNYKISLNINSATAGKYVKVLVDGNVVVGAISVPVSTTAQNVVVGTVNLTAGQHGLILRGQYNSNNNYTGVSCTFTSAVFTKVP